MNKLSVIFLTFILIFTCNAYAKNEESPQRLNDYLYSSEYFDYLIECASLEQQEEAERKKQEEKQALKEAKKEQKSKKNNYEVSLVDDVVYISEKEDETVEPFKLHIKNTIMPSRYSETFKKEDTKTIIPISDKFSFIQNMYTSRNKYSSTDYKILAGAEIEPFKFLKFASGLETNYRGLDQNPASRKVYFTPELKITNKIKLTFPNKYNIQSGSTDHDIGLNFSPFKSKSMDFGVYAGLTRTKAGKSTESINFSTNFYLF